DFAGVFPHIKKGAEAGRGRVAATADSAGRYAKSTPKLRRKYAVRRLSAAGKKAELIRWTSRALAIGAASTPCPRCVFGLKTGKQADFQCNLLSRHRFRQNTCRNHVSAMMLARSRTTQGKVADSRRAGSTAMRITMARIIAGPVPTHLACPNRPWSIHSP